MIESEVPLRGGSGAGDQVGRLAQVLALAHELEGTERLRRCEVRLRQWLGRRLRVAREIERLDGNHVPFDCECSKQELSEPAGLLSIRVRPAALGNVARDAGQRVARGFHHLVDLWRWREQAGEVANGQLDAVQDLRQGNKVAELRQSTE
jgi:hypothetical protein